MMKSLILLWGACVLAGAPLHLRQSAFQRGPGGLPSGWKTWAARAEIAPKTFVDDVHYRNRPGSLAINGNSDAAAYGGWEFTAPGVEAGKWYRFTAFYRAEGVKQESWQVVARLDWAAADGKRAGQPDYAYSVRPEGEWKKLTLEAPAPERAAAVKLQLYVANAPQGTVWWDEIALDEISDPGPRKVSIAAIHLKPKNTGAAAESVRQFVETIDRAVKVQPDVILLGEAITMVGTGKLGPEVAETIPGPTTARLAEVAKRRNSYIAAGIYEREKHTIYNTAVLIDRSGALIGKYRKVYLPREEIEAGITPGDDYPVFRTDFGTLGIMTCWDVFYTDPARGLALRGAEIILWPVWGGHLTLAKARAYENHLFLVSSGYDYPTQIIDPNGEVVAEAPAQGTAAIATVDLNRRYVDKWLGYMRGRFMKEIRFDVKTQ